jgi:hypothetical protein
LKKSEPWHAQSVICAANYLPQVCPLVDHLIDSYFKHYPKYMEDPEKTDRVPFNSSKGLHPPNSFVKSLLGITNDDKLMRVKPEFKPILDPKTRNC